MMSKLKILLPVLLIAAGGAYKFVLAKPAAGASKPKVAGEVYVLPKDFLVNLADGRYGKLNVALVFDHGFSAAPSKQASTPPDGYGELTQEPLVRSIVTDTLTDASTDDLTNKKARNEIEEKIAKRIDKTTDVKVHEVLFTDVAVQ